MSKWEELRDFADEGILNGIVKHTCGKCPEDIECDPNETEPVCPGDAINVELVEQVAGAGLEFMKSMIEDFSRNNVEK